MISIGVIGYGYWGPNIVRNIVKQKSARVQAICDLNPDVLKDIPRQYPTVLCTNNPKDILTDPAIKAVVIATPVTTHFHLAKQALLLGKHVLIEKPMATTSNEAKTLVALAQKQDRVLMVDHTFLYTPAIQKIKTIIEKGTLGDIRYIDCVRTNLGIIQKDSNVVSDLAPHDVSIIDFLLEGHLPITLSAHGYMHTHVKQESVAHIDIFYPKNIFAHMHVSWISPIKIRTIMIVGSKKMLLYDDIEPSEKIKIYDKTISITQDEHAWKQLRIGYRSGSMVAPHLIIREGLDGVIEAFLHSIRNKSQTPIDGSAGARIVRIIEKTNMSLRQHGRMVQV